MFSTVKGSRYLAVLSKVLEAHSHSGTNAEFLYRCDQRAPLAFSSCWWQISHTPHGYKEKKYMRLYREFFLRISSKNEKVWNFEKVVKLSKGQNPVGCGVWGVGRLHREKAKR